MIYPYLYSIENDFPTSVVDFGQFHEEISNSILSSIFIRIDCAYDICNIIFNRELSVEEKNTLDDMVTNFAPFYPKDRKDILNEVMSTAEPTTQLPRLLDALDKHASFIAALDNYNYILASSRLVNAVNNGDITADDKTFIESKFPENWNV